MKYILLLSAFFLIPVTDVFCQIPAATLAKIDSLFKPYQSPASPGFAVAIVKDGKLTFSRGYGMANLEYDIPITPSTIFHIASESKQFTAFCIVLLSQKGKLTLEDDIRTYLPYVPDFGKKITIRHLLTHTSGLRDQWQVLSVAGWQMDDVITQEQVIKMVSHQKELNFAPGDQMMYCNTGYTLLAEIVKKVSGQSLRQFAEQNIFQPLGMKQTHFHDNYEEIVKNRAYSYQPAENGKYAHSVLSYSTVGATSLFTTVEDEAKWLLNYQTGKVGGKEAIEQMYQTMVLNNGKKLKYALGLNIDTYKGWKRIAHGGGDAGYRTLACRFPEKDLGIILFSNLSIANPYGMAMQVADLFLEDKSAPKAELTSTANFATDTTLYKSYIGSYSSDQGFVGNIYVDSSRLFIKINQTPFLMKPTGKNQFSILDGYITFAFDNPVNGLVPGIKQTIGDQEMYVKRFAPVTLTPQKRAAYIGTYYSDELETTYQVVEENNQLVLRHRKHPDMPLTLTSPNQFSTKQWWLSNLIFTEDTKGKINGFQVNDQRILHLKFKRIK